MNLGRPCLLSRASFWLLSAINLPHSVGGKCVHNGQRGSSNWLPITRLWIKGGRKRGEGAREEGEVGEWGGGRGVAIWLSGSVYLSPMSAPERRALKTRVCVHPRMKSAWGSFVWAGEVFLIFFPSFFLLILPPPLYESLSTGQSVAHTLAFYGPCLWLSVFSAESNNRN